MSNISALDTISSLIDEVSELKEKTSKILSTLKILQKDLKKENKVIKKTTKKTKFIIILGNFYSLKSAKNLKKRLLNETSSFKNKKISIVKKKEHNYEVFLGPYNTINMIKNDYIALQEINFEEIDVKIYN